MDNTKNKQAQMGLKVEREHKPTYDWIKELFDAGEALPSEDEFYMSIAMDHLDEYDDYYTRLAEMEKQAKEDKVERIKERE